MRFSKTSIVIASKLPPFILGLITLLHCECVAIAQESKVNEEFVAFTGGSTHPHAGSLIGGSYGVGFGKNMFSFEASHQSLGNYALGLARSFVVNPDLPPGRISGSSVIDISGNYQRDLFGRRPLVFATIGFGGLWSHFTASSPCADFCYTPAPIIESHSIVVPKVGGGVGVRVPLWKSIGIRADIKYWYISPDGTIDIGSRFSGPPVRKDEVIRVTVGISIRNKYNGWLR